MNSASVRNRSRILAGYLAMARHGFVPSGAMPHSQARRYIAERTRTARFAAAGASHSPWCSSTTCARSTAFIGILPRAGRIWRRIAER